MAIQAALTCDIVNSTKLKAAEEKKLTNILIDIFIKRGCKIEFFRGDSFQAYVRDPKEALRLALQSRVAAISLFRDEKNRLSDVRISIGIENVKAPVRTLKTAKREAFILSGRKFDELAKSHQRLAITSTNPLANEGLQVISDYLNAIFGVMTGKQAEVIFELLKGEMQKAVAKKFKKTKSTIHQRITSGRWQEIEKLLAQYENIIKLIV
jgi:DNA-binding NarL/FixJ family response regulator